MESLTLSNAKKRHLSTSRLYPHTEWDSLQRSLATGWLQGEHVAIIGPTGCGKTTLESRILDNRDSVVIFVTKVHDDTFKQFPGYERIEHWPPPRTWMNKVLLWPTATGRRGRKLSIREIAVKQRTVFKDALDSIFNERNWCVVFDEQHYMCKTLGLDAENAMIQHQGRSSGLSIVNGTQRPAWVPVVTYSAATHAMIWRTTHRDDLRRISELGGVNMRDLQTNLLTLDRHDFLYVNTRRGDIMRSQVTL